MVKFKICKIGKTTMYLQLEQWGLGSEARKPRLEGSESGSIPCVDVDLIPELRCAWEERVLVELVTYEKCCVGKSMRLFCALYMMVT